MRVRHTIELREGVRAEMLVTPSMFRIAKEKGIAVTVEDSEDIHQVVDAYTKLIYLSILNSWEAKRYDDPEMGDCPTKMIDVMQWSSECPREFSKIVGVVYECLTGKSFKELLKEAKGAEVKKKLTSGRTTTR